METYEYRIARLDPDGHIDKIFETAIFDTPEAASKWTAWDQGEVVVARPEPEPYQIVVTAEQYAQGQPDTPTHPEHL